MSLIVSRHFHDSEYILGAREFSLSETGLEGLLDGSSTGANGLVGRRGVSSNVHTEEASINVFSRERRRASIEVGLGKGSTNPTTNDGKRK